MFIIGQGAMCPRSRKYLHFCLNIHNNNLKDKEWNGFNILQNYSGRVGALDLNFIIKKIKKTLVHDIYNGKYKVALYLLSADEIDFDKIPKILLLFIKVIMVTKLLIVQT